jgi:hypothetical protein
MFRVGSFFVWIGLADMVLTSEAENGLAPA